MPRGSVQFSSGEKRRSSILEFICKVFVGRGFPPTIEEICEETGLRSKSTVWSHLKKMADKGLLRQGAYRMYYPRQAFEVNQ